MRRTALALGVVLLIVLAWQLFEWDGSEGDGADPDRERESEAVGHGHFGSREPGAGTGSSAESTPEPASGPVGYADEPEKIQSQRMFLALRDRDLDRLRELLDAGVPADVRNWHGRTPLNLAIRFRFYEAANLLLEHEAKIGPGSPQETDQAALDLVCSILSRGFQRPAETADFADVLLQRHKITPSGAVRLTVAVLREDAGAVRRILAEGVSAVSPTNPGRATSTTPLQQADWMGAHAMVELLLRDRATDPKFLQQLGDRFLPLQRAAARGDLAEVSRRLDAGADIDGGASESATPYGASVLTPLFLASMYGQLAVVELLVARGADVNIRQFPNGTALSVAVKNGHVDVVRELLANRADPDRGAPFNPITQSVLTDRPEILHLLITNGADVEFLSQASTRWRGKKEVTLATPLCQAARLGRTEVLRALLQAGADPEAPSDRVGFRPIEWAVFGSHADAVEALLRAGADPAVLRKKGPKGRSAMDLVEDRGQVEVAAVLNRHGLLPRR